MRSDVILACAMLAASPAAAMDFGEMFPSHPGYEEPAVNALLASFDYRQGSIPLPGGQAEIDVPAGFYYLGPQDATEVLTTLWGNPPQEETLGMIFPAAYTPWDIEAWGVELQFDPIGYVSDKDAEGYDYDALLRGMQADVRQASQERVAQGYESMALLGWAEPPRYDPVGRKLHWAMELQFGDAEVNTLNYKLRALGREGTLNANFIGDMSQLEEIKAGLPAVAGMIGFVDGKRYSDFDPSLDAVAAVGIGGLIAGKVLTSKAGLMAVALVLLKKFWLVLLLPVFWLSNLFRRRAT